MTNTFDSFFLTILFKTWQHLTLTFFSLILAIVLSIPFGIYLTRLKNKKVSTFFLRLVSLIQTIPSLALMALIIVFFVSIRSFVYLPATGFFPGLVILTIYALLPILQSTYVGISQVNSSLIEVALARGMTKKQILFIVEMPIALPFIVSGIRTSLVWTIGMATLTSLIGSGGLGDLIMQGLKSVNFELILAGTLPAAFLAISLDYLTLSMGKWLTIQVD